MVDAGNSLPFSLGAREVLSRSHEEATRLDHSFIGTEHLFLALAEYDEKLASSLAANGVTAERFRDSVRTVRATVRGTLPPPGEDIRMIPRAQAAVGRSVEAAQRLESSAVEPAHLMLGVLDEPDGVVAGILASYGVDRKQIADQVAGSMSSPS
jgi:ATP-dependent Clp protease ATP-binding subunit ClpC